MARAARREVSPMTFDVHDRSNIALNTVSVESPGNMDPAFDMVPTGGTEEYSSYEYDVSGCTPAYGDIPVLITVETEVEDFAGYITGTDLAAYHVVYAPVSNAPQAPVEAMAEAEIEPYFDGFGPDGTAADPIPTEWYLTLDASASTGPVDEVFWEMNGDDLFDEAEGLTVSAGFPESRHACHQGQSHQRRGA